MFNKLLKYSFIIFLALVILNCSDSFSPEKEAQDVKSDEFNIQILDRHQLPYNGYSALIEINEEPSDSNGILLYELNENTYYHPVIMAEHILRFIDAFFRTDDSVYYQKAIIYANKMMDIGNYIDNTILFPYDFDLYLHGKQEEKLDSGWYSGMAQGEALSAFVRLYNLTQNPKYLTISNKIYNGFFNFKKSHKDWFVYVDDEDYYWIEEYPMEEATHVLNGFIYAVYGLYDYYLLTGDEECLKLMQAAITTIKNYLPEYRVKNYKSYYCLKHKAQGIFYHQVHILELKKIRSNFG